MEIRIGEEEIHILERSSLIRKSSTMSLEVHACPPTAKGTLNFETLQAAKSGKLDKVKSFLANGGDVNGGDLSGTTLLFAACEHGRIEVVNELLKQPDLHLNTRHVGVTAIAVACVNGHEACVTALLESPSECKLNWGIINNFKNKKPLTALGAAAFAKHWNIFKKLQTHQQKIQIGEACDILLLAVEEDQWDIISEFIQRDIKFHSSVYNGILKEAYSRQLWDIIDVIFRKAITHENGYVLYLFSELFSGKDWMRLQSLLQVLSETAKIDVELAEALHKKQHREVEKKLKDTDLDIDTLSGCLLLACIAGTNETVVKMLLDPSHNYSDDTLKYALLCAAIYNHLEFLPQLLKMGNFSFKVLSQAKKVAEWHDCRDSLKMLKVAFNDKMFNLFPNIRRDLHSELEKPVSFDSDDEDDDN